MTDFPDLLFVVGARPQFVKLAAVTRALDRFNASQAHQGGAQLTRQILHTGQHYDHGMSQVFFDEMDLPAPDANLGIGSGPHGAMTGRMLEALEREFLARRPRVVVTFGDTNSTLAAALAAVKLHIPSAHIEAGLRAFDLAIPEEVNRVLTDRLSRWLFTPSDDSAANLVAEGIGEGVHIVGDVMFDCVLHYRDKAIVPERAQPFALATLHRQATVDDPGRLREVIGALARCPVPVVFPVHPRTRSRLAEFGLEAEAGRLTLVEPLSYFSLLGHLQACSFVMTDSGGLQKEAYYLGKRCITLRDETEWTELVDVGANKVVGTRAAAIEAAYDWAQKSLEEIQPIYGDGTAADQIVRQLAVDLAEMTEPEAPELP